MEAQLPAGTFVNPAQTVHLFDLKEGSMFADFGCGSGAYVLAAAPLVGQTGSVVALDVQKDLLLKLKQTILEAGHSNVKFLWGDFEQSGSTNLPDASLDVALLSNTLFQIEDKLGALEEIHRVLKQEGALFVIDWSESFKGMGPAVEEVVTEAQAQELLAEAGFKVVRTFAPGEHHYGLECSK